ncbi:transcriptional regulator family: Fungal Specific TF [Paecilomyces variotii]|nr:transcriptional regulator family: Fungal Specific TF [Paecilomyces variotii]KAJ9258542.1 transcriptional regulator family: Fungal Specific TF [Paecilomyces variotii]KAJ9269812.1 transcriptional regulator family: Fungal Specific TF [Paecilomyces variotii]KAJ9369254.1 transcriptional regulator family: Fungal Specific TF [Paecilomyces variotii]
MTSSQPPSDPSSGAPLEPSLSESAAAAPKSARTRSLQSGAKSSSAPAAVAANAKVPIPRQRSGVEARYSRRVAKACESCRQRKTKCSGDTPVCRQCRELRVSCHYPDGMREKTKRHLEELSSKTQDFEQLLRDLENVVDGRAAERIKRTLAKHSEDEGSGLQSARAQEQAEIGDLSPASSIGSLEAIDRVEEDLNRGEEARATGYIGKNSEISWMQRLHLEAEQRSKKEPGTAETEEFSLPSMNYHLDDMDITVEGPVDLYWMPSRPLANQLFQDYLRTVHPYFPIINRPHFTAQFRTFYEQNPRPGDKWLAILNLIFAIAAKHAHLIQASWRGDSRDHLVYFTRARILSLNGDVLFSHPDLQQVQVEGLIAFYLLSSDQINRAWRISALAVRSAIALGINMKNTSVTTHNLSKEARYRVWWSLYSFEHLLGIMTGRVTCILDGVSTAPLPLPWEEEQLSNQIATEFLSNPQLREAKIGGAVASDLVRLMPLNPPGGKTAEKQPKKRDAEWLQKLNPGSSLFYLYLVDLTVITQEIVNKVYTADAVKVPWSHIENRIGDLKARIDLWFSLLPEAMDFTHKGDDSPEIVRWKLGLALQYYSARITLGRPCLCRRDAQFSDKETGVSFSHRLSIVSLDAAARMLDLVPDVPDPIALYEISPWWSILHCFMQATTVLLLELSFGCVHIPGQEMDTLNSAKKAIRWLHAMSRNSIASKRAWRLCDGTLRRIATGMDYDVTDMPPSPVDEPEQPPLGADNVAGTGIGGLVPPSVVPTYADWTASMEQRPIVASEPLPQPTGLDWQPLHPSLMGGQNVPGAFYTTEAPVAGSIHFPYDPISGEFIRSFFPNPEEEPEWEQWE